MAAVIVDFVLCQSLYFYSVLAQSCAYYTSLQPQLLKMTRIILERLIYDLCASETAGILMLASSVVPLLRAPPMSTPTTDLTDVNKGTLPQVALSNTDC